MLAVVSIAISMSSNGVALPEDVTPYAVVAPAAASVNRASQSTFRSGHRVSLPVDVRRSISQAQSDAKRLVDNIRGRYPSALFLQQLRELFVLRAGMRR
jgi:hypothetical protein